MGERRMNRVERALDDWRRERRRLSIIMLVLMVVYVLMVATTAVFVARANAETALAGQHRTLASGRTYWLTTTPTTNDVLVIGLPGTALSAANTNDVFWATGNAATTGWQRHAAAHGYTLALGESSGGRWNVGGGWPGGTQNDVDYLVQVVADAEAQRSPPDPFAAVYVAGFSAGGAMSWTAVANRPDVFAACGMASGWAASYPTHAMDCWHVHGTGDTTVPVRGGVGTMGYNFPPAFYEQSKVMRDSKTVLEATSGGHGTPGWMADRLWQFWTTGR